MTAFEHGWMGFQILTLQMEKNKLTSQNLLVEEFSFYSLIKDLNGITLLKINKNSDLQNEKSKNNRQIIFYGYEKNCVTKSDIKNK